MEKIAEMKGHTNRILAVELGPDGEHVASIGADESLRFWRVFERKKERKRLKSEKKDVLR
jgi:WD40 repeat protein